MKLSVLLPVHNEARHITACLDALRRQTLAPEDWEVIVIDGGSSDETVMLVERSRGWFGERLRLLANPQRTTATGLNRGLAAATGEIIARVDGHSMVPPEYLQEMAATLADPLVWAAGAAVTNADSSPRGEAIWAALRSPFGCGGSDYREPGVVREVASVQAAAYRREVFDRVGQFNETMDYAEDDEFNWRVRRAGGKIVLRGDLTLAYQARDSFAGLARQMFHYGQGRVRMLRVCPGYLHAKHLAPLLWLLAQVLALIPPLAPLLLSLWVLYLAIGFRAVRRVRSPRPLTTLLAFPVLHFSYGAGFLGQLFRRR